MLREVRVSTLHKGIGMARKNCWEVMDCGLGPDSGLPESEMCIAATETRVDGVHGGQNGGRCCWAVAGTLSTEKPVGKFACSFDCIDCAHYGSVIDEEMPDFVFTPTILKMLGRSPIHARHEDSE